MAKCDCEPIKKKKIDSSICDCCYYCKYRNGNHSDWDSGSDSVYPYDASCPRETGKHAKGCVGARKRKTAR